MIKESDYIESLKTQWRQAMRDRENAIKRVNHYDSLITQARKEREQ